MKRILAVIAAAAIACPAFAAGAEETPAPEKAPEKGTRVKEELKNHFSLYGFIRNYFAFDSRESASGTGNLFYYLPFDRELDSNGEDLNATPSFRFLSITSRVGLDVKGNSAGRTFRCAETIRHPCPCSWARHGIPWRQTSLMS